MFTRWNAPLSASDVVHSYNNDGKMLRSMAWTIINYINAVCPQVHVNLRRRHTIWKMAHHQHHLYHLNECVPYVSIAQWEWEKWERGCSIVLFGFHSSTIRPDAGRMNKWWWWWWLQIATMTLKTKAASGHNGKESVKGRATNREKNDEILSNEHEWPEKQKMFRPHQTSGKCFGFEGTPWNSSHGTYVKWQLRWYHRIMFTFHRRKGKPHTID